MDTQPAPAAAPRHIFYPFVPIAAIYSLFVYVASYSALKHLRSACYWYYDLGIYAEAVARLGPSNLNPWLTGRQIRIFNDHFDPIIWLVVPLAKIIGEARALIVFESLSVLVATVPLVYLYRTQKLALGNTCAGIAILLFHPAVILALEWPAHPTTWAIAPAVFLGVAMVLKKDRMAFFSFVALLCCKEEFVYVGMCLTVWFFAVRKPLFGAVVGVTSAAWLVWVFVGRAYVFGPTMAYSQKFTQDIWLDPWAAFVDRFAAANLPFDALGAVVVFGALGLWAWRARLSPAFGVLAMCLPIVSIRFIAKMWGFQYNAVTVGFCVAAFLPALMKQRLPRSMLVLVGICLVLLNGHKLFPGWPIGPVDKMHPLTYCPNTSARLASLHRAFELAMQDLGPILAEQNLLPNIASHPALYQLDGPQPKEQRYEAVLFEKPPNGTAWRESSEMIAAQIAIWRRQSHQVLIDDGYVFYARGIFDAPMLPSVGVSNTK